jgi:peptide/nickel transport system substrate-binding protein
MNKKISIVLSLVVLASMLLSACGVATTVAPPAPTTAPTQPPAAKATNTAAPAPTAVVPPTAVPPTATAKPVRLGGWLDQVVFTGIADAQPAVAQLQAGAIDLYNVTVGDPNLFNTVKADKNLSYSVSYGGFDQLMFNTVACTDKNVLNPFTDMKIREAMNWAVDRNYVSQEILGGLGTPRFTVVDDASADAARYAADMAAMATEYAYNLAKAQTVVDAEMATLGATKDAAGKFQYKGKPVTIIGLIRTEDARKQMGIYFAQQLEKLGFTVNQQLKTRAEAGPIWQGADLGACAFGYYTAGWISSAITLDEGNMFAQYNTGDIQNIPLFLKYQPSPEYSAVLKALENNTFKTMAERDQLFHQAFQYSMTESWQGVMVANTISFSPFSAKMEGASDLMAGFGTTLFPFTARFTGQEGGSLRIAESGPFVQAWNPVAGSNWVDDLYPQNMTNDHGTIPNPYTGLNMAKLVTKMELVAKTGLPINKTLDWVTMKSADSIAVPDDAWADWDATKQVFITAKDRLANAKAAAAKDPKALDAGYTQTANVQVTVTFTPDLFKTKWHDGANFSMGDILMDMILSFDPAKKDSKIYDAGSVPGLETFMSHFKGVKIVSTDPLTITTWDDKYQLNAESNVFSWYPSYAEGYLYGSASWANLTPAILAEIDGKMAFSLPKSGDAKIDETSLISGPTLLIQSQYLDKVAASGDVPFAPTLGQYVKIDEAKASYAALQAFYKAHGHLLIGTGPYYIDKVDTTAISITLKRFPDYLFPADQFTGFSEAPVATATVDGPTQVKAGDDAPFTVTVKLKDKPYPSTDIAKVGYTLFGSDGSVIASGEATKTAEGAYAIDITPDVSAKMLAGATSLSVAVASKTVALPTFVTYQFIVTQ